MRKVQSTCDHYQANISQFWRKNCQAHFNEYTLLFAYRSCIPELQQPTILQGIALGISVF